jgi:aminopeptidase YwaD
MTLTRGPAPAWRRTLAAGALAILTLGSSASTQPTVQEPERYQAPTVPLPPSAERAYRALSPRVDGLAALETVRYMDQFWRIAGNPGFNSSIDYIRARLLAAGFADSPGKDRPHIRVEEWGQTRGWDYQVGTVAFADDGEVLLSRLRDRVSLCINSFSTPNGGLTARLIDVGDGSQDAHYDKLDVKGAVVLGDADAGRLWQNAVKARGALGVISTRVAPYIRPSDPKLFTSPDQQDVFQWGQVPYDADAKAFGFKASWRAASRMRERLKNGPVQIKVDIESTFYDGPTRSLIAEIPGAIKPDERIVLAAHVQEPGANDDGSGCGTLLAVAAALAGTAGRGLQPPGRTITLLWIDEIRGSRQWLTANPDRAKGVQYMFSLDMTGEDTAKTGGTFLIEKQADPSAVWTRPSDPHSEWGAGEVKAESLKGSLLNDVHLAVSLRRAKDTKWVVRTNPYEGGSDHTAFGDAGIPSVLNWHFTDRYYHTNLDRPDKTSALEMINVGVAVATSAWFLASADERDANAVVDLLTASADARLALERRQSAAIVAAAADRARAEQTEAAVMSAWQRWYREALDSVRALPVRGSSAALDARIAQAQGRLDQAR